MNKRILAVAAAACLAGAANAADGINFSGTADNSLEACLSPTLSWAGCTTALGSHGDWRTAFDTSAPLTGPGYLLVRAVNEGILVDTTFVPEGPAMFVANLSITGAGFQFAGGGTERSTADYSSWMASGDANFAAATAPVNVASGYANTPDHWAFGEGIDWGATKYVWLNAQMDNSPVYFATGIEQISVVPEPQAYAMALAGLGIVGALARRRRPRS